MQVIWNNLKKWILVNGAYQLKTMHLKSNFFPLFPLWISKNLIKNPFKLVLSGKLVKNPVFKKCKCVFSRHFTVPSPYKFTPKRQQPIKCIVENYFQPRKSISFRNIWNFDKCAKEHSTITSTFSAYNLVPSRQQGWFCF